MIITIIPPLTTAPTGVNPFSYAIQIYSYIRTYKFLLTPFTQFKMLTLVWMNYLKGNWYHHLC